MEPTQAIDNNGNVYTIPACDPQYLTTDPATGQLIQMTPAQMAIVDAQVAADAVNNAPVTASQFTNLINSLTTAGVITQTDLSEDVSSIITNIATVTATLNTAMGTVTGAPVATGTATTSGTVS